MHFVGQCTEFQEVSILKLEIITTT